MVRRRSMPCIFHSAFLLFILSSLLSAQAPPTARSTTSATPTFRANSRLVQFDVIVLDGNGRPIRGLAQNDFKIFEDGKPQQVRSFDAHETKLTAQPQEPFHLPPHQYTNVPVDEPRGPLTDTEKARQINKRVFVSIAPIPLMAGSIAHVVLLRPLRLTLSRSSLLILSTALPSLPIPSFLFSWETATLKPPRGRRLEPSRA